jgi:hypothetical protein
VLRGHGSKTLALALLSACGGAAPSVDSNAVTEAGSAFEAADVNASPEWDASAVSDAAEDAGLGLDAEDALTHDAASAAAEAGVRALDSGLDASAPRDADPGPEASVPADSGADARTVDAFPPSCSYPFEPSYAFCKAAVVLEANLPPITLNTANGARGDCATDASGAGGLNLYYRFMAPAGADTRVVATTTQPNRTPLIRILTDCYASKAESSARGFSEGKATACIWNRQGAAREVIIALAQYSGEGGETMTFEVSVTGNQGCP